MLKDVAWSPDGKILASCSSTRNILLWHAGTGRTVHDLEIHNSEVDGISWSPDGNWLSSASWDNTIILWMVKTGNAVRRLRGHDSSVRCVAWAPDGNFIASGSNDRTVRIWNVKTGRSHYLLEGHTDKVLSVGFLDDGKMLASLAENGRMILWRTDTWAEALSVDNICCVNGLANLALHPTQPVIVTPGRGCNAINIWHIDLIKFYRSKLVSPTTFYVNAKAVLLGDSGVGKSGLGIRIAEGKFRHTKGSTHGAQFWHFSTDRLPTLPSEIRGELTLWDLAGQPEYRLTHQLFLDDVDAALLLFDCSDYSDPFRGVPYWAKVLRKHAPPYAKKYLVSARCDVSPVTADRRAINQMLAEWGLDEYLKTSAKTGEGVDESFNRLLSQIPWQELPRTSTPELFQAAREFLLERKEVGINLLTMEDLRCGTAKRCPGSDPSQEDLDTIVQLLQNRGLVFRIDPRSGLTWVLLKPERINQYGASIIQAARNHERGIGAVSERDALRGVIPFTGFERLPPAEEMPVLEGTLELLIRRDLCFREMGYLVFPSQINITREMPPKEHPRTEVAYRFSGGIETIYASLVVRLSYTDYFRREDQWKYAVEFSISGQRLGFSMRQVEEGTGELEIYFHDKVSEFDRVTFIRFITDHLLAKGVDIEEKILLYCPSCSKEVKNRAAIKTRIKNGKIDIPCQFCDTSVVIPKSVEEIYQRNNSLGAKQEELAMTVGNRTKAEVAQLREDRQQYILEKDHMINILHLSDLHFSDETFAHVCRAQLETDLVHELKVGALEYLVISGDIADSSTEEEYRVAFAMVDGLVKRFGLTPERVVIVPGNHDLSWGLSKKAYQFTYKNDLPATLPEGRYIPAGDAGALLRDDALYHERFKLFSEHFYRRVYSGQNYPLEYADQLIINERPDDRILFIGLNSCWELDHHFRQKASINMEALAAALDRFQEKKYDGWLKVAVWHHPVAGKEMMDDSFMQLLSVHKFQVCLHGHIHRAREGFFRYDKQREIHIVGAGTFGAPAKDQTTGVPLQYNLLTFHPCTGMMTVNTRKKEDPDGAWSADARWGDDKNNPKPFYSFQIQHYQMRT
jgi:GTPase SAR1 family protein/predicted MPP superfamily phosphohydrolase